MGGGREPSTESSGSPLLRAVYHVPWELTPWYPGNPACFKKKKKRLNWSSPSTRRWQGWETEARHHLFSTSGRGFKCMPCHVGRVIPLQADFFPSGFLWLANHLCRLPRAVMQALHPVRALGPRDDIPPSLTSKSPVPWSTAAPTRKK